MTSTPTRASTPARQDLSAAQSRRASRGWWDSDADAYQAEHGEFPSWMTPRW